MNDRRGDPGGRGQEKDLMQYYRSARDGFEGQIKAEAQERTAQDAQAAAGSRGPLRWSRCGSWILRTAWLKRPKRR